MNNEVNSLAKPEEACKYRKGQPPQVSFLQTGSHQVATSAVKLSTEEEECLVQQALAQLPSLDAGPPPPCKQLTSSTSHSISPAQLSHADEALLLETLALLSHPPGPFHATSGPTPGSQEKKENVILQVQIPQENDEEAVLHSSRKIHEKPIAEFGLSFPSLGEEQQEEVVLGAVLAAAASQQTSVSGELPEEEKEEEEEEEAEKKEKGAVARLLTCAERIATASLRYPYPHKGDRILHFHEHVTLWEAVKQGYGALGRPACVALTPKNFVETEDKDDKDDTPSAAAYAAAQREAVALAMGMSLGAVVLFNREWRIVGVCGSLKSGSDRQRGGVVALSLSDDGGIVAAGHDAGDVVLWSVKSLSPLRIVSGEFKAPLVQLKHIFYDKYRVLALDAAGRLKYLSFTRLLGRTMVRSATVGASLGACITTAFDVLPYPSRYYLSDMDKKVEMYERSEVPVLFSRSAAMKMGESKFVKKGAHLVAVASKDSVLLYVIMDGLYSSVEAVAQHARPPATLASNSELVSFVVAEQGARMVYLCVAWKTEVEVLSLRFHVDSGVVKGIESVARCRTPSSIRAMCPAAAGTLVGLLQNQNVVLFDVSVGVLVERHLMPDLKPVDFCYPLCGARSDGAVASDRFSVLVLDQERVLTCSLLPWDVRLRGLTAQKKFSKALDLVQELTEEVALSVVGLPSEPTRRRKALRRYIEAVCVGYLDHIINGTQPVDTSRDAAQKTSRRDLSELFPVLSRMILFCNRADEMQVFFGPVMNHLREAGLFREAFYSLETSMLHNILTSMPEQYIDAFFQISKDSTSAFPNTQGAFAAESSCPASPNLPDTQEAKSGRDRAEEALMHLEDNLSCLLRLAKAHGLIRLEVVVLSVRQHKFTQALEATLEWEGRDRSPADLTTGLTNHTKTVALDYLECTLKGQTFIPGVEIPVSMQVATKRELWKHLLDHPDVLTRLLRLDPLRVGQVMGASLSELGPQSPWDGEFFPFPVYFAKLFAFLAGQPMEDACVFCFGTASPTASAANTLGLLKGVRSSDSASTTAPELRFQPWQLARRAWPPYETLHQLFEQILPALLQHDATTAASPDEIFCYLVPVAWERFVHLFITHYVYTFQVAESAAHRERIELQLVSLLWSPSLAQVALDARLDEFRRNSMARCSAALYARKGWFKEAIQCFLDVDANRADPRLSRQVFPFLRDTAQGFESASRGTAARAPTRRQNSKQARKWAGALRRAVLDILEELTKIDPGALTQFVLDYMASDHRGVVKVLERSGEAFLRYLDDLLSTEDRVAANNINLQNCYIELLCAHNPNRVYTYLRIRDAAITYDVKLALEVATKYRIADACVFLLGKTRMLQSALEVLTRALESQLRSVQAEILESVHACEETEAVATVVKNGEESAAAFCGESLSPSMQRRSVECPTPDPGGDPSGRSPREQIHHLLEVGVDVLITHQDHVLHPEELWFALLDIFTTPLHHLGKLQAAEAAPATTTTAAATEAAPRPVVKPPALCEALPRRLLSLYASYAATVLRAITHALDPAVALRRLLAEASDAMDRGALQRLLVEALAALRAEGARHALLLRVAEADLRGGGAALWRRRARGVAPRSDRCGWCGGPLRGGGPPAGATAGGLSVCVRGCGHGGHEACRAAAEGGREGCPQCTGQGGGSGRPPPGPPADAQPERDDAPRRRRLAQARAQLDRSSEYQSLADFLSAGGEDRAAGAGGSAWHTRMNVEITRRMAERADQTREPATQTAVSAGELSVALSNLNGEDPVLEKLNDADILRLFGE